MDDAKRPGLGAWLAAAGLLVGSTTAQAQAPAPAARPAYPTLIATPPGLAAYYGNPYLMSPNGQVVVNPYVAPYSGDQATQRLFAYAAIGQSTGLGMRHDPTGVRPLPAGARPQGPAGRKPATQAPANYYNRAPGFNGSINSYFNRTSRTPQPDGR